MSPYEPPWMQVARKDEAAGVLEIPGPEHHPRIVEMHSYTTLRATEDEIAWCSSAMCSWIEECDLHLTSTRSARARSWLWWGMNFVIPAYGCIVILRRGGPGQPGADVLEAPGHVGLFVGQPDKGLVTLLGGNQSNQVCERTYRADRVLGYRWPM